MFRIWTNKIRGENLITTTIWHQIQRDELCKIINSCRTAEIVFSVIREIKMIQVNEPNKYFEPTENCTKLCHLQFTFYRKSWLCPCVHFVSWNLEATQRESIGHKVNIELKNKSKKGFVIFMRSMLKLTFLINSTSFFSSYFVGKRNWRKKKYDFQLFMRLFCLIDRRCDLQEISIFFYVCRNTQWSQWHKVFRNLALEKIDYLCFALTWRNASQEMRFNGCLTHRNVLILFDLIYNRKTNL